MTIESNVTYDNLEQNNIWQFIAKQHMTIYSNTTYDNLKQHNIWQFRATQHMMIRAK